MARLFPLRSETPARDGPPRVVDLDDEDADAVFGALSSTTARQIYSQLDDEPGTPSDVAEAIDSSIQNVRYHLEKLEDAGLVEVVDTWYSSRGNEMSVYATANGPLIVTSDQSRATQLKEALTRFVGAIAVLGVATLFVQGAAQWIGTPGADDSAGPGPEGEPQAAQDSESDSLTAAAEDDTANESAANESAANKSIDSTADDGGVMDAVLDVFGGLFSGLSPGLLFFLGGLSVLVVAFTWWYVTTYRPTRS